MSSNETDNKVAQELREDMFLSLRLTDSNDKKYLSAAAFVRLQRLSEGFDTQLTEQRDMVAQALTQIRGQAKALTDSVTNLSAASVGLELVPNLPLAETIGPHVEGLVSARDLYRFSTERFLSRAEILPMQSVVLGQGAGLYCGHIEQSVILGHHAGLGGLADFKNYVVIGAGAQPMGNDSVTLGHSKTQVYLTRNAATRADPRDYTDTRPLDLGLDFLLKLKPQRATMDLREDYVDYASMPTPPAALRAPPTPPTMSESEPGYRAAWAVHQAELAPWLKERDDYKNALKVWRAQYTIWLNQNNVSTLTPDGTHKRDRAQLVLMAGDVVSAANAFESSFPGVFDGKSLGGLDVQSLVTEEMIPVLVKGVQDLHALVHSDSFIERVAAKMVELTHQQRISMKLARRQAALTQDESHD